MSAEQPDDEWSFVMAITRLRRQISAQDYGPIRSYIVLSAEDFDALRARMIASEKTRFFFCKPRRKKPDDRRSIMISGIMIYSEEARPSGLVETAPGCPLRGWGRT